MKRIEWNFSWGGVRKEIGMMIESESLSRDLQTSRKQLIIVLCIRYYTFWKQKRFSRNGAWKIGKRTKSFLSPAALNSFLPHEEILWHRCDPQHLSPTSSFRGEFPSLCSEENWYSQFSPRCWFRGSLARDENAANGYFQTFHHWKV